MVSVAWTRIAGTMLGRMWTRAIRQGGLPMARAASTNSSAATARTCARVSRMKVEVAERPMAIIALTRLGPRKAASAIARIRKGIARSASVRREIAPSIQPPA